MANPWRDRVSPAPHTVCNPSAKVTFSLEDGKSKGFQRIWLGFGGCSFQFETKCFETFSFWKGSWTTLGRILYNQVLEFSVRGAVKAVPESCSAYNP